MKRHLSPIHLLLRTYGVKPSDFETLSLADRPPNGKCTIITDIAPLGRKPRRQTPKMTQLSKSIPMGWGKTAWWAPQQFYSREATS